MVTLFLNVFLGVCVCLGGEFIANNHVTFLKFEIENIN
jgi:hypothetical protein